MKKRKIFLSMLVFVFVVIMSASIVFANEISLDNIISGKVTDITVKDSKQPHVIWELPSEDKDEMITLLNCAELSEGAVQKSDRKIVIYVNMQSNIVSISVYDNGSVIIEENTEYSKEYIMENFDDFKNGVNVLLTTQSKGYGNAMPSKSELVKISDWASESYQRAIDNNILPEYMKIGYMTDDITREQFCDITSCLLKIQTKQDIMNDGKSEFLDTNNINVSYLVERDIIQGKSEFNFSPNDFLTREEAATILDRTVEYLKSDTSFGTSEFLYRDDSDISDWAKESVYRMEKSGVMIGTDDHNFSPKSTFTKEQAITTILRVFDNYIEERDEQSN